MLREKCPRSKDRETNHQSCAFNIHLRFAPLARGYHLKIDVRIVARQRPFAFTQGRRQARVRNPQDSDFVARGMLLIEFSLIFNSHPKQ